MSNDVKLYKCYKGTCSKCLDEENPYITEDEYKELLDADGKVQCPEGHLDCGIQELKPQDYPQQPKDKKKLFLLGGGVLIILVIIAVILIFIGRNKSDKPLSNENTGYSVKVDKEKPEITQQVEEANNDSDNDENKVSELLKDAENYFSKKEYDKAKIIYNSILVIDPNNQNAKQRLHEIENIEKPSPPGDNQTNTFPNGDKYVGEMKNGKMHGLGTYYFNSDQIISERDLKRRKALKGDYLIGEWNEGNVVQGKLFGQDNTLKEVIIIGKTGN